MADRPRGPQRGGQGDSRRKGKPPYGKSGPGPRPGAGKPRRTPGPRLTPPKEAGSLSLKRLNRDAWAFVAPDCACERQMDLDDARDMRAKREEEIARDELLYLVADCHGFMDAHNLLGELALEQNDVKLARGHYGYCYENGLKALPPGFRGLLPADQGYNAPFFEAGRGLARCLIALGQIDEGRTILKKLATLDPDEPDTQSLLSQLQEYEAERKAGSAAAANSLPIITGIAPLSAADLADDDEGDDDD